MRTGYDPTGTGRCFLVRRALVKRPAGTEIEVCKKINVLSAIVLQSVSVLSQIYILRIYSPYISSEHHIDNMMNYLSF